MMRRRKSQVQVVEIRETREQAARSISCALEFLRHEAYAIGMREVGDLIERASEKANQYCPAGEAQ
jgi:hypothetical protein